MHGTCDIEIPGHKQKRTGS